MLEGIIAATKTFKNRLQNEVQNQQYKIMHFKKQITERKGKNKNCE
jgi:hypothetical protein